MRSHGPRRSLPPLGGQRRPLAPDHNQAHGCACGEVLLRLHQHQSGSGPIFGQTSLGFGGLSSRKLGPDPFVSKGGLNWPWPVEGQVL